MIYSIIINSIFIYFYYLFILLRKKLLNNIAK
nr:MAG TPA: hypothetical protein [Caudoviricetes sp.]